MKRGGLKGMPAPPTRPFANAHHYGEGAREADRLLGVEGPVNPAPATGLNSAGGSSLGSADSVLGRGLVMGSPAHSPRQSDAKKPGGKWIGKAIKHPGALHRQLGVPEGKKIPAAKLAAAAKKGGQLGRRARLAQTLKKLK